MDTSILAPAAVLAAWTLLMLAWMAAVRLPAMKAAGLTMAKPRPGGRRGADLEGVLPDAVNWKAHNYAHLLEQPTLFYALVCILAIAGGASGTDVYLAWGYVGLRVVHSMVQATVNFVPLRFSLFLLSTLLLLGLVISALQATL